MSKLITVNYNQKPCYNIVIENDFSKLAENVTKLEISGRKLAVITAAMLVQYMQIKLHNVLKKQATTYLSIHLKPEKRTKILIQSRMCMNFS